MKLVSNFVRRVRNLFTNTKVAVKQEFVEAKTVINTQHQVTINLPKMIACAGAPIPSRVLNQRQRRKLQRQK